MVQILYEVSPNTSRLASVYDDRWKSYEPFLTAQQAAASVLGLAFRKFPVGSTGDLAAALSTMDKGHFDAIVIAPNGVLAVEVGRILRFAAERRLPMAFPISWPVERGGLLSYSPSVADLLTRVAALADRILNGTKPADLPFEYPTRYELAVNLKTARALGIELPQAVRVRIDRIIE